MNLGNGISVAAISLGVVITPGPNMMYMVSRSIAQGRRAGVVSLGGVAAGALVFVVVTNLGLTAVLRTVPVLYTSFKIAGAAYLGWLAWQAFRSDGASVFAPREMADTSTRRLFAMGLVTNLLNPKIALLYLSLIPQFVDIRAGHVLLQGFAFGGIQVAVSVCANLVIILVAGTLSNFLVQRPTWLRIQRYVTGAALGTLALLLATDQSQA
ncbi:LysE family translocator [Streptomyces sp. N50]|uniref:LysE family translocator n=1 Tax=Streptomyces sp. N50 TaxID=3081765 RepID=UPI0029623BC3|nr:LysE family translocator [Streptomyces sp. N50]WOX16349.1 LysE family translocator [Streptomyces sp. N50]